MQKDWFALAQKDAKDYGFNYGPVAVTRIAKYENTGAVVIGIDTAKVGLQVYVTKTGKVRFFKDQVECSLIEKVE